MSFDISNACAGMMTGVFILNDLIRHGRIRRGMVVSGEYISQLGVNAAREVETILSDQLASLTLGDAGAAAILERARERSVNGVGCTEGPGGAAEAVAQVDGRGMRDARVLRRR